MKETNNGNTSGRIKDTIETLSYDDTKSFFGNRASKYNKENPYSVTMYQDNNPELVNKRNIEEVKKLKPYLCLSEKTKVLDIACGIGRWSDAITEKIEFYCGLDFSSELIDIAKSRNRCKERVFYVAQATETEKIINDNALGKFSVILLMGILIYLNDSDLNNTLSQVVNVSDSHSVICFREPIGITNRLTLKNYYSSELNDNYNAIYRTYDELMTVFNQTLSINGFELYKEGVLFDEINLNNRSETGQYYFIYKR